MIPNPYPGIFIVLDGNDGCGKTAQLERTGVWLSSFTQLGLSENLIVNTHRFNIRRTEEPGKERFFGKKIYADLVDESPNALHKKDPHGFQAWYACDSKEHLVQTVIPGLENGAIVLSDRFRSSMVYGATNANEIEKLMRMNQAIIGEHFIWPDKIIIFDVPVEISIARLRQKGIKLDGHEKESVLQRVRRNFLAFADKYPNCEIIHAQEPIDEVFEKVKVTLLPLIKLKKHIPA